MLKIITVVFNLATTPVTTAPKVEAAKVVRKADVIASERIIRQEANGERSRKLQVRKMWSDEYKLAKK